MEVVTQKDLERSGPLPAGIYFVIAAAADVKNAMASMQEAVNGETFKSGKLQHIA